MGQLTAIPRGRILAPDGQRLAASVFGTPAHDAADRASRAFAGWNPSLGSADADLLDELDTIRGRSRDLGRNESLTASAYQTYRDNIVGHVLRLSAQPDYRMLDRDKEWADEWGNGAESWFHTWSDSTECDAARTQTLIGLTHQALTGALMNGDALAIPVWEPRPDSLWGTRLQMIEADRLDAPPLLAHRSDIRKGVEIDRYGAPVAYHIRKTHPGDRDAGFDDFERIPAFTPWGRRRVIHLYDKERSGQSRGKPIVAAVMKDLRMSGNYAQAELKAAVVNALVAAFIESDLPQDSVAGLFSSPETQDECRPDLFSYWNAAFASGNAPRLEGGAVIPIPIGAKLASHNPGRPATAFGVFMNSVIRRIAAGLHLPYELLLKDFSQTNYSSARAALLEAWRFFLGRRRWLADMWLQPVYELWMEEAVNLSRVSAPGFYANKYAWLKCRWVFAGRGWVDPVKEANAAKLRLEAGLSTQEMECAEQGLDWEEVMEQQAREQARRQALGLPMLGTAASGASAPPETDDEDVAQQPETADA